MGSLTFLTDAVSAIKKSVSDNLPLMLYISDHASETIGDNPTDNNNKDEYITRVIIDNKYLSEECISCISEKFIRLKIIKGSTDYLNLLAIMPLFDKVVVPCLFFIYSGQVIDAFPQDIDPIKVEGKIMGLLDKISKQSATLTSSSTPAPPGARVPTTTNMSSPPPEVDQSIRSSNSMFYSTSNTTSQEASSGSNNPSKSNAKSLKEEAAELAALKYRESLLKQRQQAMEDRQRILHLLEQDRRENKPTENVTKQLEVHENIHNVKLQNREKYTIQLKLLDGSTKRVNFKANDRLLDVRSYILKELPEYNSFPFYFFKNIDRITYGDAEELQSLKSLNLNMSTLIIKPMDPEDIPKANITNEYPNTSSFGWFKSKIYSFLWPESNPAASEADNESDKGLVYHTPPSHTPCHDSNSSLRPVLSSFNLYGSQSFLSSSSIDLVQESNSIPPASSTSSQSLPQAPTAITSSPSPPAHSSEACIKKPKNKPDKKKDENNVDNGNSVSIHVPEDQN